MAVETCDAILTEGRRYLRRVTTKLTKILPHDDKATCSTFRFETVTQES